MGGRLVGLCIFAMLLMMPSATARLVDRSETDETCWSWADERNETWQRFDGWRYYNTSSDERHCESARSASVGGGPVRIGYDEGARSDASSRNVEAGAIGESPYGPFYDNSTSASSDSHRSLRADAPYAAAEESESCASTSSSTETSWAEASGWHADHATSSDATSRCERGAHADAVGNRIGVTRADSCAWHRSRDQYHESYHSPGNEWWADHDDVRSDDACERSLDAGAGDSHVRASQATWCRGSDDYRDAEVSAPDTWANQIHRGGHDCGNATTVDAAGVASAGRGDRSSETEHECYRESGGIESCWGHQESERGAWARGPAGIAAFQGERSSGFTSCWDMTTPRWCNTDASATNGTSVEAAGWSAFYGDRIDGFRGCDEGACGAEGEGHWHGAIVEGPGQRQEIALPETLP